MATAASKYQPGSRGPLRRTVDRRGVDGAAPRIWSASWRVMGCPAKCRRARATAFCPDVEPVHDRLDVDVLNLNVRADLGHTPITNHQSCEERAPACTSARRQVALTTGAIIRHRMEVPM